MVIRCPECATRFKVADRLVGEKPIKLKCSKCKIVFTYQRAAEPVRAPSPSHPRMPVVKPKSGAVIGGPAPEAAPGKKMIGAPAEEPAAAPEKKMIGAPAPEPEAPEESFESFEEEEPAAEASFESFEEEEPVEEAAPDAPEPGIPDEEEARKARGVMDVDEEDFTGVFEPAIDRRAAARAATEAAPAPAGEAVSSPSLSGPAITLDEMLPAPEPPSRTGRAVGILAAALVGLVLIFGLFVMWRNAWDFGALTQDPMHAMRVSLGMAPRSLVPADAKGIDATVLEWYRARTTGEHELLVVSGEVYNTTAYPKTQVLVEVAIVNSQGVPVFTQEAVAGITLLTREAMAEMSVLEIREQVQKDEERARGWTINPERKASFQAYFTTYPPGVDDMTLYTIEATVTSAKNAIEE